MLTCSTEGREGELMQKMKNPGFELVECSYVARGLSPWNDAQVFFALRDFFKEI